MDAAKMAALQKDVADLLRKYHIDGFTGMAFKNGRPDGAFILYDPADTFTRLIVLAMADKIEKMYRDIPNAQVIVGTGLERDGAENN